MVKIRKVLEKDAKEIVDLSSQLGYHTNENDVRYCITKQANNVNNCMYAALIDERVVGWVQATYFLRLETSAFVEITGLIVNLKSRKQHIGKNLVSEVLEWAKTLNIKKVKVRCNTIRLGSHKFYEKLGFELVKKQKVFEINP